MIVSRWTYEDGLFHALGYYDINLCFLEVNGREETTHPLLGSPETRGWAAWQYTLFY